MLNYNKTLALTRFTDVKTDEAIKPFLDMDNYSDLGVKY
jgi:hypothetical protein